MNKSQKLTLLLFASTITTQQAAAFGLADVVSIGMDVGGKVVGAAIDKAKDAARDPEAEKAKEEARQRKVVEAYQKQVDAIEARSELSPLQREKLVRILQKQYNTAEEMRQFVAVAERRQREERGQILTAGGLAGAVGSSAMNSPSMVMARADAAVRSGEPQAMSRNVMSQVNNHGQMAAPVLAAQADRTALGNQMNRAIQQSADANRADVESALEKAKANAKTIHSPVTPPRDFFSQDYGKKLYVVFNGSSKLTAQLRETLSAKGYSLVEKPDDADVKYWLGGEFGVNESKQNDPLQEDIGAWYDNPHEIAQPKEKTLGKAGNFLGRAMLTLGGVSVQQQPVAAAGFQQYALVVAARQPADDKESRISTLVKEQDDKIVAESIIKKAIGQLMEIMGISGPSGVESSS